MRRLGFSPKLSLLIPASSLPFRPDVLTVILQPTGERSPTDWIFIQSRHFGDELSPDNFRCRTTRPVSCYALFKGLLLLSQPPGCLSKPTSFDTLSSYLGTLVAGLGCFPFDNEAYPPLSHSCNSRYSIRSLISFGERLILLVYSVLYHCNVVLQGCP